jgi:hypothetical protein
LVSPFWLVVAPVVAGTASALDMLYLHVLGVETLGDLLVQTAIGSLGLYGGHVLSELFHPTDANGG